MMDYTRLTQWGTWEGTVTLPTGVTLAVDPARTYATRDRSWGVRGVGQQAPTNFEPAPMQVFWLWHRCTSTTTARTWRCSSGPTASGGSSRR